MKVLASYRTGAYLVLVFLSLIYLGFMSRDGRWFFFDDFAALRYVNDRSYAQIIGNSFVTRDVDYHKFLGYLVIKFLYNRFGTDYHPFLLGNFLVHTINAILVFEVLTAVSRNRRVGLVLAGVFLIKLWLWWPSNFHDLLAGSWYFAALLIWIRIIGKDGSDLGNRNNLQMAGVAGLYLLGLATKATVVTMPAAFFLLLLMKRKTEDSEGNRRRKVPTALWLMMGFLVLYGFYFGRYFALGREKGTGYAAEYTVGTFLNSQAKFWSGLAKFLPDSQLLVLGGFGLLALAGIAKQRRYLWFLGGAYLVSVAPTSFFKTHASPYYIYIPAIYALMMMGRGVGQRYFVLAALVVVLFDPTAGSRKMITKYRHGEYKGFDQRNMEKLVVLTRGAIDRGEREFYFSSWEMSPNLYSAVYHDALGLFLGRSGFDAYRFGYDRNRETVIIRER